MTDLTLDVWQFVRLMVCMEESLNARSGGRGSDLKSLYDKWEDLWVDLDARLVDLGKHDMDAFADLMMDQEVVLEEVTAREKELVRQEFDKVLRQIKARLAQTDDPADVEDLSFERDEIVLTLKALGDRQHGNTGGRPGSAPAGKPPARPGGKARK